MVSYLGGDARGIRTPDRRLRRPLLYPAELVHLLQVSIDYYNPIIAELQVLIGFKLTVIELRVKALFIKEFLVMTLF